MDWCTFLNEFTKYFTFPIRRAIENYQTHLKDIPEEPEISVLKKGVSGVLFVIPYIGKPLASGVDHIFKRNEREEGKRKAEKSIEVINLYEIDSDAFVKLLTEAAFDIFFAYSQQFSSVTAKAGQLRAMQKLGLDAGERFLSYIKDHKMEGKIAVEFVTKAVVLGKSKSHQYKPWENGRKLIITQTGKSIRTADFFENIGICLPEDGASRCFAKKSCSAHNYLGYRRPFRWEDMMEINRIYEINEGVCQYKCEINYDNKDIYIKNAYDIAIKNTTPHGNLKLFIDSSQENLQQEMSSNTDEMLTKITETFVDFSEINNETMKQNCHRFREMIDHNRRQCVLYHHRVRCSISGHPYVSGIPVC